MTLRTYAVLVESDHTDGIYSDVLLEYLDAYSASSPDRAARKARRDHDVAGRELIVVVSSMWRTSAAPPPIQMEWLDGQLALDDVVA